MGANSWAQTHGAQSHGAQSHAPEFAAVKVVKRLSRVRGGSSPRALEYACALEDAALSRVPRCAAWSACCALARERGAAAAHWRHDELVTAAGARLDVGAGTEAQVLAEANAHLAQTPAAAGHRDAVAAEAGIGLHERLLDLVERDRERRARRDIGIGDLHRRARLAHILEIDVRAQPRAGAVAVPLVEDQARRRHQIEHGRDDVAIEPRRRLLAEFREAPLVLRPQPVHDEGIGPRPALLLRRRAAFAGGFAERRRPGERQHVEGELSGLILAGT